MKSKKSGRSFLFFCCFLMVLLVIPAAPTVSMALQNAQIAIYNDTSSPEGGAWSEGLTSIRTMLDNYGYSHIDVTPDDVNQTANLKDYFQVIIFGGGWAGGYNTTVTEAGYANIRAFVMSGGGYFGICAGAYFASDIVYWKPNKTVPGQHYDYPLDLFSGAGIGAVLGIAAWTEPTGCATGITTGAAMTVVSVDTTLLPDVDSELQILYFGGPILMWDHQMQQDIEIIARYQVPNKPANNKPAMIMFPYGLGKVFLSGPHPEISFNSDTCMLYNDMSTWQLMNSAIRKLLSD